MTLSSNASWAASSTAKSASPRGNSKQTRNAMNAMTIAMPAQSKLKKSIEEISVAAYGETNAQTTLAAELSEIKPKTEASFQCTLGAERSPPLSVILNGRPNGLTTALYKTLAIFQNRGKFSFLDSHSLFVEVDVPALLNEGTDCNEIVSHINAFLQGIELC